MKKVNKYLISNIIAYLVLIIGLCLLLTFVAFAIAPEHIAKYDPKESFEIYQGISPEHILGTNDLGYDIMSEIIYATRPTLIVGISASLLSLVIGVVIGILSGYLSGVVGEFLNGVINFFMLIPMLPLAIVVASYVGGGEANIILIIAILGWCGTARAVRAKTIKLRKLPYVEIMKGLGYSEFRILFKHILPNIMDVALARYISSVASCILLEATLGFLGLGAGGGITWGQMVNYAYKFGGLTLGLYNWLLAPGICIMLLVLSFYFINYFFEFKTRMVKKGRSILE